MQNGPLPPPSLSCHNSPRMQAVEGSGGSSNGGAASPRRRTVSGAELGESVPAQAKEEDEEAGWKVARLPLSAAADGGGGGSGGDADNDAASPSAVNIFTPTSPTSSSLWDASGRQTFDAGADDGRVVRAFMPTIKSARRVASDGDGRGEAAVAASAAADYDDAADAADAAHAEGATRQSAWERGSVASSLKAFDQAKSVAAARKHSAWQDW